MAPPQMTILNAPSREACTARRERTNTPLQALLLLNETEYMKAARHLAQKVLSMKSLSDTQKLSRVYEAVTSKVPDAEEAKLLASMIKEFEKDYTEDPKLASQMCEGISLKSQPEINKLAAWTMLVNTLFNFDITKTRE